MGLVRALCGVFLILVAMPVAAQTQAQAQTQPQPLTMPLYPDGARGSEDWTFPEYVTTDGPRTTIHNVREPEVSIHLPDPAKATGAALVMLPGGGLRVLGVGAETDEQIRRFNERGIAVILLKYRILQIDPDKTSARASAPAGPITFPKLDIVKGNANPAKGNAALDEVLRLAVADGQAALRLVRAHADKWSIDPARVGMIGTSAGGGVAIGAMLAGEEGATPDFIISIFGPSLQDVDVPEDAPPLFLATEAEHGPVTEGMVALANIWRAAGKHAELHVYDVPTFAMPFSLWGARALDWMEERGFLNAASGPVYDDMAETSLYIPGYDGTKLALSVYRPVKAGVVTTEPLPVIVTQNRSSAPERLDAIRRYYVTRGYVVVSQDRRGTGASFGTQEGFVNDADRRDAKAVIDWAAAQPFSTGKVGAMGCSNQGIWQYGVAALKPKALKAIVPACASPQFFDHAVARGGIPIFEARKSPYSGHCPLDKRGGAAPGLPPSPPKPVTDEALKQALSERGCTAPMLGQYWLNMARDGVNSFTAGKPGIEDSPITYWREIRDSGVAILQLGGWFDAAVAGQIEGQRLWGGKLVMGPWGHGNRMPEGANFPNADYDLKAETLRWFDHYLKGIDNGAGEQGIEYYAIGAPAGQEWKQVTEWGHHLNATSFYLSGGNSLTSETPPTDEAPAEYARQDVTWFAGKYSPLAHWWSGDMAKTDAASLVHTGGKLDKGMLLEGTPRARLWISSDQKDVNIFAVIEDIAPDGRSTYVTDGFLRASWRKTVVPPWGETPQTWHRGHAGDIAPLTPGEVTELLFDFFPISYVFRAGHRIRLSISTSIGNPYQASPLVNGAPKLTVYREAGRSSALELPLSIAD